MSIGRRKSVQAMMVMLIAVAIVLAGAFAWYSFSQQALNIFEGWTNPDVNLHDDYEDGDENKDVYVENSGQRPLYIRVRLEEYMQINGTPMNSGAAQDNYNTWFAHNYMGTTPENCINDYTWEYDDIHDYYNWILGGPKDGANATGDPNSGWKYYIPAPFTHRALFDSKGIQMREPTVVTYYQDTYAETRVPAQLYGYNSSGTVTTANWSTNRETPAAAYERIETKLGEAFAGTDAGFDAYKPEITDRTNRLYVEYLYSLLDAAATPALKAGAQSTINEFLLDNQLGYWDMVYPVNDTVDVKATANYTFDPGSDLGTPEVEFVPIRRTLETQRIYTMAQWIAAGAPSGQFWIMDNDGWCYWGEILMPGQSTGLLLSEVMLSDTPPAGVWWYGINVSLEAVTFDDLDMFWTNLDEDGRRNGLDVDITEQGRMVLNSVSGQYVFDVVPNADPTKDPAVHTFFNNKDNTYRRMTTDGAKTTYGPLFIYTGPIPPVADHLNNASAVGAAANRQYKVGDKLIKDIPFGNGNTQFTVLDAGNDISYATPYTNQYASGVIEVSGKRYVKLGYGTQDGINNTDATKNNGWSNVAWLAVGPDGKFDRLLDGPTEMTPAKPTGKYSAGDDMLIWTDAGVLPGNGADRYQEEDDSIKVRVGEALPEDIDSITWVALGTNKTTGETLLVSKEVLKTPMANSAVTTALADYAAVDGVGDLATLALINAGATGSDADITGKLLSIQDAIDYLANGADRIAYTGTTATNWWLSDGMITTSGSMEAIADQSAGIRVAVWVKSENLQKYLNDDPAFLTAIGMGS